MTNQRFNFDDLPTIPINPEGTVILILKRSCLGETRSLRSMVKFDSALEDRVNKTFLSMMGKIYVSPELRAIRGLDLRLTMKIASMALPSILRTGSTWVLPITLIPACDQLLDETQVLRIQLVSTLIRQFDDRVTEMRSQLGPIADQFNWLTGEDISTKFGMSWSYYSFGVPESLANFDPLLYEREKARMIQSLAEQESMILNALYEGAMTMLSRLESNLTVNPETGNLKRFYDSSLQNIRDFLELLPQRQLVPAPQFEALMARTRDLLSGLDAKELRKSGDLAIGLQASVTRIIDGLVEVTGIERVTRRIRFEPEDPPVPEPWTPEDDA